MIKLQDGGDRWDRGCLMRKKGGGPRVSTLRLTLRLVPRECVCHELSPGRIKPCEAPGIQLRPRNEQAFRK